MIRYICGFLFIIQFLLFNNAASSAQSVLSGIAPYETNSCEERQTPGLICYSCSVLATCVKWDDRWETIPVEQCDNSIGLFCNLREGGCSNRPGPCNNVGHHQNFVCTSVGIFPDPYDCQKYHMCYQSGNSFGAINVECGSNRAFNAATGDCSLTTDDHVCLEEQFTCDYVGQKAAWTGNENIFYICKSEVVGDVHYLYPSLYRCPSGEIFDGEECIPCGLGTQTTTTTTRSPIPQFECPQFGLYPNEADCQSYFFCNHNLIPIQYHCPIDTYFSHEIHGCVRGNCTHPFH